MKVYTYNNKVLTDSANGKWLKAVETIIDYNPLGLDPGVFRIQVTPGTVNWSGLQTATLVPGTTDVYDVQFTDANITLYNTSDVYKVLGANASSLTTMAGMFNNAQNLVEVALFDTSNVTDMTQFIANSQITHIPDFPVDSVTNVMRSFLL